MAQELMPNGITPRLLTIPQAAVYLGVSVSRTWQYVRFRKLHPVRLPHPSKQYKDSRKTLLDIRELDSFIDQHSEYETSIHAEEKLKVKNA